MPFPIRRKAAAIPIAILALAPSLVSIAPAGAIATHCAGRAVTHTGTAGDDVIYGTTGDDVIFAGPGNDRIFGLSGHDVICGGAGADRIDGGYGWDEIHGGPGNDRLIGGHGDDRIWGNIGSDDLYGGDGNDRLRGGRGNDRVAGQRGVDVVGGQLGVDLVLGERPQKDGDQTATKAALAALFARVGYRCGGTACELTSAGPQWFAIPAMKSPTGVTYTDVSFVFDSDPFALQMMVRGTEDSTGRYIEQQTAIYADGWLLGVGRNRAVHWTASRTINFQGGRMAIDDAIKHITWVLKRM